MVESSVWLNASDLFIPALVGVVGSFGLYWKRRKDSKENLRVAFLAELQGTSYLDVWPNESIPSFDFLSVTVYESNTGDFGLLSDSEIKTLVRYYTRAKAIQDALRFHSNVIAHTEGSFESDIDRKNREKGLRTAIDKLELARQRAILTIEKERENTQLPEVGMRISSTPDKLQEDKPLLLDFGLADKKSDDVVITEFGSQFFHGKEDLAGTQREYDTLNRNKSQYRKIAEGLLRRISELIGG